MLLKSTYYAQLCSKITMVNILIACINPIRNRKRATSASATTDVYYIYGPVPLSLISEGLGSVILSLIRDTIMYRCTHTWVTLDFN